MNWFEARDLAARRVAIRRSGWTYWLIYRARVWMIIDKIVGVETRRVVRATDFRDSEFLAKDWTTETWEGGSYPPCTLRPDEVRAPLVLTSRRWTLSDFCGGDGTGGNVVPVSNPSDDPVVIGNPEDIGLKMILLESVNDVGDVALVADSSVGDVACWITPPPFVWIWALVKVAPEYAMEAFPFYVALNTDGADLSDLDPTVDPGPLNTYFMSSDSEAATLHTNYPEVLPTDDWYAHQFILKEYAFPYVPGATITAMAQVTYRGTVYRTAASFVRPAICED